VDKEWPKLDGCLVIMFASRSGSTFLCRSVSEKYKIEQFGEDLNPVNFKVCIESDSLVPQLKLKRDIQKRATNGWFAFKGGFPGITGAERLGLIDQYQDRIHILFLLRRDLVAQAISLFKAEITGQFHSTQKAQNEAVDEDFDAEKILRKANTILKTTQMVEEYINASGQSATPVFYEEFQNGDFSSVEKVLDGLSLPRRDSDDLGSVKQVARLSDSLNAEWKERILKDHPSGLRDILVEYDALLARVKKLSHP